MTVALFDELAVEIRWKTDTNLETVQELAFSKEEMLCFSALPSGQLVSLKQLIS